MRQTLIITLIFLFACNDGINDKSKRNAGWCWWVDTKTHKGQWIPVSNFTTVDNGEYTLFYFNGANYERGKLQKGKYVDTTFMYDLQGKLFAYILPNPRRVHYLHDGYAKTFDKYGRLNGEGLIKNHTNKNSNWVGYYENGNREFSRNFGLQDTIWEVDYYESGQMKDSSFRVPKNDSSYSVMQWYEDGKVKRILQWNQSFVNTYNIEYLPDGSIKKWSSNKDGILLQREWLPSGQLHYEWSNPPNGIFKEFYETGQLKGIAIRKPNKPIESRKYDKAGNITEVYKNGDWVKP